MAKFSSAGIAPDDGESRALREPGLYGAPALLLFPVPVWGFSLRPGSP
jgi:hypothetical protein